MISGESTFQSSTKGSGVKKKDEKKGKRPGKNDTKIPKSLDAKMPFSAPLPGKGKKPKGKKKLKK
jgi:hypothetical protein